jgi:[ribosomal protein S18]-alanine N-acetyltransferase
MGRMDTVHWGAERLRVAPWRGDPTIAYLAPAAGRPPSEASLVQCLADLSEHGYQSVLTSALTPAEQQVFRANRFVVHEHLHLLRHPLDHPIATRSRATRRGRRRDRAGALAVDHLAFEPFWRFDEAGLEDARHATPVARFRVIDRSQVAAYAVTGRAGSISYLQRLAVHPERRRLGLGTDLVLDSLHWAQRHGSTGVLVNTQESNQGALALYEHLGFRREPDGLDVLELSLADRGPRT